MPPQRPRFRYTPLPPNAAERQNTRLLELLPDRDPSSVVKCMLHMTSLYQNPSYEALSYCWGNSTSTTSILCNGAWFNITTSLHSALTRLRDKTSSRILWVDAICINQSPTASKERSQQVQMMKDVYRKAKTVIVWLGDFADDSHLAVDLIRQLHRARPKLATIQVPYFDDKLLGESGLPFGLDERPWLSLQPFFQRPWFQRIWVVQEVAVANNAIVICEKEEIPWDDLVSGIEGAVASGLLASKRAVHSDTLDFLQLANIARLAFHKSPLLFQKYSAYNLDSIFNHLLWFRRRSATNNQDKAFALYGLRTALDENMELVADYDIDIKETYRKLTISLLNSSKTLDVLSVPHGKTDLSNQLPFWVADWSDSANQTISLIGQTRHIYSATKNSIASPRISNDMLILDGYIIDTISQTAPILEHSNSIAPAFSGLSTAFKQFSTTLSNITQNQHVLTAWKTLAISPGHPHPYPTGQSPEIVFETTLLANLPASQNMKAHFQDWRKNELPRPFLQNLNPEKQPWKFKAGIIAQFGMDVFAPSKVREREYTTMAYGRRMARTGRGFLSLVPAGAGVGDCVVLAKGGKTPLILRRRKNQWILIGDCYVHGVMGGEGWDEGRCGELWVV